MVRFGNNFRHKKPLSWRIRPKFSISMMQLAVQAFLDQGGAGVIAMVCGLGILFSVFGAAFASFFRT